MTIWQRMARKAREVSIGVQTATEEDKNLLLLTLASWFDESDKMQSKLVAALRKCLEECPYNECGPTHRCPSCQSAIDAINAKEKMDETGKDE